MWDIEKIKKRRYSLCVQMTMTMDTYKSLLLERRIKNLNRIINRTHVCAVR